MSDIDNVLKDFLRTTRSMESNIVSIISDSNRDIEMILKELLIYLDATSKNLEKVQGSLVEFVDDFRDTSESKVLTEKVDNLRTNLSGVIKTYSEKLIELEVNNTKKVLELARNVGVTNQKMLKQILIIVTKVTTDMDTYGTDIETSARDMQEIKSLLSIITSEVKDTKINVTKNQDNLMTVIGNMMDASKMELQTTGDVETQKIKSEEEKFKAKSQLVGKIVGIVLGSGGVIYLIIDVIIKAAA